MWLYILFGYKVFVLVIGCFIVWIMCKVKVYLFNDLYFVCMVIYIVVVCVIVGILLVFLINEYVDVLVGCLLFVFFFFMIVMLCLFFILKVRGILVCKRMYKFVVL